MSKMSQDTTLKNFISDIKKRVKNLVKTGEYSVIHVKWLKNRVYLLKKS